MYWRNSLTITFYWQQMFVIQERVPTTKLTATYILENLQIIDLQEHFIGSNVSYTQEQGPEIMHEFYSSVATLK